MLVFNDDFMCNYKFKQYDQERYQCIVQFQTNYLKKFIEIIDKYNSDENNFYHISYEKLNVSIRQSCYKYLITVTTSF